MVYRSEPRMRCGVCAFGGGGGGAGGGKGERGGGSMRRSPGARRGVGLRLRSGVGADDEEIVGRAAVISTGNWWCSNRIL